MKESIGYTVSLNIMIVFITIIVAFLCAALIYFKSNKVSNVITSAIEKYEGYNSSAISEINRNLTSVGYSSQAISCAAFVEDKGAIGKKCTLINNVEAKGSRGYCVYKCEEEYVYNPKTGRDELQYYYYKIRTNMMITIPIVQDILNIPIYSNTNRLYNFSK